ncbi:MAG: DUF2141 domain-containing protein [Elusimicrobiaceae bacterium]|nr:DUF2141 domain-containing protein [Elusimicrobiaceae bacterium]
MKKILFSLFIAALAHGAGFGLDAAKETGTVSIAVHGLRNDRGQVVAALFDSAQGFPAGFSGAFRRAFSRIDNGGAKLVFADVPYGRYAVALCHDENADNVIEMAGTMFVEGFGASNNAVPEFGPPDFEYAAFKVNRPDVSLDTVIRYGLLASRRNFPAVRAGRETGNINVTLDGFSSNQGLALVALYAAGEGFPYEFKNAAMFSYSRIKNRRAAVAFKDVPYGQYAVIGFHDLNANGRLDMDRGFPAEGTAVSGDALHDYAPVLFNSAVFDLEDDNLAMSADMRYDLKHPRRQAGIMEPGKGGDLILKIDGADGDAGVIMAALFKSGEGFPADGGRAAAFAIAFIHSGQAVAVFRDLPFGRYAASVYQDKDGNGRLNRNIFGRASEPRGFSRNVSGFMGSAPSYEDAEFAFDKDARTLSIHLR